MSNDSMARLEFRAWAFFRYSSLEPGHSPILTLQQRRADQINRDAAGVSRWLKPGRG